MIEITNIRQGAILNHNHGKESDEALTILLEGFGSGRPVKVNGEAAEMVGRRFTKEITLTQKIQILPRSSPNPFIPSNWTLVLSLLSARSSRIRQMQTKHSALPPALPWSKMSYNDNDGRAKGYF